MKRMTLTLLMMSFSLSLFAHENIDKLHNTLNKSYQFSSWKNVSYVESDGVFYTSFLKCEQECVRIDVIPFNKNNDYQINTANLAKPGSPDQIRVEYTLDAQNDYNLKGIDIVEGSEEIELYTISDCIQSLNKKNKLLILKTIKACSALK